MNLYVFNKRLVISFIKKVNFFTLTYATYLIALDGMEVEARVLYFPNPS